VEKLDYIEIKVNNTEKSLTPKDLDIKELKDFLSDIETLLFPEDKKKRPKISYTNQEGSIRHIFYLPTSIVISFNSFISEIKKSNSIDFLVPNQQEIICKLQKKAKEENLIFEINNSKKPQQKPLVIDYNTNYQQKNITESFYESEFYLYGEIIQQGGVKPNIHLRTEEYGSLTIGASKEQILDGENKLYQTYGIKVKGKRTIPENDPFDLELVEFVGKYEPVFDEELFNKMVEESKSNMDKIDDLDKFIEELKSEYL